MESRKAHQWLSVPFQFLSTVVTFSDLTMLTELTMLKPPLQIGPISIFHLILSGFKFQMKEKILLLISFANSAGTFNVEHCWQVLTMAIFCLKWLNACKPKHLHL